ALVGRALLAMNRREEAKGQLELAEREMKLISTEPDRFLAYTESLRAELLLREQKWAEGAALMKQIEERIRSTPSPDARSQALFQLESIARIARETSDWELAEFTAREMIQLEPSYAGGYYALALVAEHRGQAAIARQEFARAEKLWNKADPDLPELGRVRQKLAALLLGQAPDSETSEPTEAELSAAQVSQKDKEANGQPQQAPGQLSALRPRRVEVAYDSARLRGSPTASVVIVEFSDFQCPYCRQV